MNPVMVCGHVCMCKLAFWYILSVKYNFLTAMMVIGCNLQCCYLYCIVLYMWSVLLYFRGAVNGVKRFRVWKTGKQNMVREKSGKYLLG